MLIYQENAFSLYHQTAGMIKLIAIFVRYILTCGSDGILNGFLTAQIADLDVEPLLSIRAHEMNAITAMACFEKTVVTAGLDGNIRQHTLIPMHQELVLMTGFTLTINCIAINSDWIVVGGEEGIVKYVNRANPNKILSLEKIYKPINCLSLIHDENTNLVQNPLNHLGHFYFRRELRISRAE
jgi:hypothetical protein